MDSQNKQQHQHQFQTNRQEETFSESKLSLRKRVGQIVTRRRSPTETNNYHNLNQESDQASLASNKMPTPKGVLSDRNKYRIKNRVKTQLEDYEAGGLKVDVKGDIRAYEGQKSKKGGRVRTLGVENGGAADGRSQIEQIKVERKHARNKSFQQQRQDLQKQLKQLLMKKSKLQQLRQNKKILRAKLNHLQVQLKQIKNNSIEDTFDLPEKVQKKPRPKLQRLKPIKPVKRTQTYEEHEEQLNKLVGESTEEYMRNQVRRAEHQDSDDQEIEVTNYYYEAQLNHKCLNCKHYHTKIEDVRIPVEVKNDFNL